MADQVIGKLWLDGTRVLVLRPFNGDPPWVHWYVLKVSKIPVGLEFIAAGNGFGMIRTEDPDHPEYPAEAAADRDAAADEEMAREYG